MPSPSARVTGYTELIVALKAMPKAVDVELRAGFKAVGQVVATDWSDRMERLSTKTAAGLKPVVRLRGVEVDQTLRKTTGLRPDWGREQMVKGEEALVAKEDEIVAGIDVAMDRAAAAVGL